MRLSNFFIESIEHGSGALRFGRNAMVHRTGRDGSTASSVKRQAIAFGSLCRHPDSRALIHPPVLIGPCVTGVETAESRKSSRR